MFCSVYSVVIVLFCVLFVCKCVLYYCQRMSTQLLLTNISTVSIQFNKSNPRLYYSPDPQAIYLSVAQKSFITKLGLKALPFFRSIEYKMATGILITVQISARL